MKTPWGKLLDYGVAIAAVIVIIAAGLALITVVGVALLVSKVLLIIR